MQVGLTTASAGCTTGSLIATLARKADEADSMVAAMAQLYVYGHDLDFRTLFAGVRSGPLASGAVDYADIPPTDFKPSEHSIAHFLRRRFGA